ncbi:uncharacterized protein MELLADRAFT_95190 [Melampsora larici-populina 98AG31]|uniref:Uncharacterized protein n=1 Tax=Melampsora larici-populina (strain 98AG31 / pathotype 3-4-7) TaxID=747676 RepID=F4RCG4_MELLP|nr:uncharacterized protein MELLADRAFT_95190 [Melampsora larici-populina 98AG31]EGG09967.1 hypothetical protein MELLADRAFT_95190 [Melampsora larici-populina 98AG31]
MPRLSDYFDKFMTNKNRHVPVSIFNVNWLLLDKAHMSTKKTKIASCSSDVITYPGLPVLSEWRLSSAEWSKQFDLMVQYHRTIYNKLPSQLSYPIAPRLVLHKAIVLEIQMENQGRWMPAFRYDMAQQQNIWEHRLADGKMSDVGTRNELLVKQAIRDSEFVKDDVFDDNPYALGYALQNQSPIDGQIYPEYNSWDGLNTINELKLEGTGGRLISALNPLPSTSYRDNYTAQAGPSRNRRGGRPNNHHSRGGHVNGAQRSFPIHFTDFHTSNQHRQNGGGGQLQWSRGRPAIGPGSFVPPKQLLIEGAQVPGGGGGSAEKGKGPAGGNK